MKCILVAAAVLLGSTAVASAHAPGVHAPSYAPIGTWRFGLLAPSRLPRDYAAPVQTLTGGASGGPNQS